MNKHYIKHLELAKSLGVTEISPSNLPLYPNQETSTTSFVKESHKQASQYASQKRSQYSSKKTKAFFVGYNSVNETTTSPFDFQNDERELFEKILSSLNSNLDSIHLRFIQDSNIEKTKNEIMLELQRMESKYLILLGSKTQHLLFNQNPLPYDQIQWKALQIEDSEMEVELVAIPSMKEIIQDVSLKKPAWLLLKHLKGII